MGPGQRADIVPILCIIGNLDVHEGGIDLIEIVHGQRIEDAGLVRTGIDLKILADANEARSIVVHVLNALRKDFQTIKFCTRSALLGS